VPKNILLVWAVGMVLCCFSEFAIATENAVPVADEAGKIEPGLYWDHITAAYVVTWLALIGYTCSLWVRRPKGAAK